MYSVYIYSRSDIMSLAAACKKAVTEQMSKSGSGESSLAQACQDAILQGLQPLISEVSSLSTMINKLMDGLGKFGEDGEKGVLTEALTRLGDMEETIGGLTKAKASLPSFTEEGSFGKDKDTFLSRKVIDDEIRRCRDSLIITFDSNAPKIGQKLTGDLVKALNAEKKRLPTDLKNLTDQNGEIKQFIAKDLTWSRLRSPREGRNADKTIWRLRIDGQYGKKCMFLVLKHDADRFGNMQVRPEIPAYLREANKVAEGLAYFIRKKQTGIRTKCSFNAKKNGIEVHIGKKIDGSAIRFLKVAASFTEGDCVILQEDLTDNSYQELATECLDKLNNMTVE